MRTVTKKEQFKMFIKLKLLEIGGLLWITLGFYWLGRLWMLVWGIKRVSIDFLGDKVIEMTLMEIWGTGFIITVWIGAVGLWIYGNWGWAESIIKKKNKRLAKK